MNISEIQSKTVDWLRFPLIVGVVFIHCRYFAPDATPFMNIDYSNISAIDVGTIISSIFSIFIPNVAVPIFFMISGYFFFNKVTHWESSIYQDKLKSRTKTLLIPYLLWNTVALLTLIFLDFLIPQPQIVGVYTNVFDYLRGYFVHTGFTPYLQPMWFIRDLIILCIASPVLYYLLKKFHYYILFVFLALNLLFYYLSLHPIYMIIGPCLFYFSLGAFFSISNKNMVEESRKVKWLSGILYPLTLVIYLYLKGSGYWKYISPFSVLLGIATTLNIVSYLYEKGKLKTNSFLAKSSFFLFAIHEVLLLEGWKYLYLKLIKPISATSYIIGYFTVPVITILSALLIFYLLQTYLPKVADVLTGNRK